MSVTLPEHQTSKDFPTTSTYTPGGKHYETVTAARKLWGEHLAKDDWEDLGTKDGVALAKKPNPADPEGVPITKGVTSVPNTTTDQVLGAILPGGIRKLWDPRLESAGIIERLDPSSIEFYTAMRGQMFISGRDFVGVQWTERSHELNQAISITQVSIVDEERGPAQSGRVRGQVHFAGWLIEPDGSDVKLTYITCVSLEGSLPMVIVRGVAAEVPMCTARVREVYTKHGYAPIFAVLPPDTALPIVIENERSDAPSGKWTVLLRTIAAGSIPLRYDSKHWYKSGVKIATTVKDGPQDALAVTDDGTGTLTVEVKEPGAFVEVALTKK